jgi:hypothetical protein
MRVCVWGAVCMREAAEFRGDLGQDRAGLGCEVV